VELKNVLVWALVATDSDRPCCWPAGPCSRARKATLSWPSTAATRRGRSRSPSSRRWRVRAGEWRSATARAGQAFLVSHGCVPSSLVLWEGAAKRARV
jgi:hypothetical protein